MTVVRLVLRLAWIPIAFGLSAMVAAAIVLLIGQERFFAALHSPTGAAARGDDVLGGLEIVRQGIEVMVGLASGATLLPALALVVVGEVARIRSALYYIVGGGAALAVIPLLARFSVSAGGMPAVPVALWQVFATAGFAAGLVYWLLAGRRA